MAQVASPWVYASMADLLQENILEIVGRQSMYTQHLPCNILGTEVVFGCTLTFLQCTAGRPS